MIDKLREKLSILIGDYDFSVTAKPDANNIQVWIKKSDGEGMGMTLLQFKELMDNVWKERF